MHPLAVTAAVTGGQAAGTDAAAARHQALLCGPTGCPAVRVVAEERYGEPCEDLTKLLQRCCELLHCLLTGCWTICTVTTTNTAIPNDVAAVATGSSVGQKRCWL